MLSVCLLVLVLNGTAAIGFKNRAVAMAAHVAQAAQAAQAAPSNYVECNCMTVAWNRSVSTWSYAVDHPNLSVEYH